MLFSIKRPKLFNRRKTFRDMMKCSHENCPEESAAFHNLFKEQRLACDEMCNPGKQDPMELPEEERKIIFRCMKKNKCMPDKAEFEKKKRTLEFDKLKECTDQKCPEQVAKMKSLTKQSE